MGKTQKNKKPRENQQKTIFGDSLGKLYWQNQKKTSRKPKNQKTKTFQRMFGLRLMFGFFWFCLGFFWFFLVLTLKKLKKLKVFSQKETKATNTQKPKKTLSFFGFSQFFNPKKLKVFFSFLDKMMVKEVWKTKIQGFFLFFIAQPKRN